MFSSLQLVISTGGGEEGSVVAQIIGAHRRHRRQRDVALPPPLHPSLRFLPSLHLPRSDWRRSFLVACARTCVEYGRAYTMHRRRSPPGIQTFSFSNGSRGCGARCQGVCESICSTSAPLRTRQGSCRQRRAFTTSRGRASNVSHILRHRWKTA